MERAEKPELIVEAEEILKKYARELSLDSISIFRKDGMFFYSSDPTIYQQENAEFLFDLLEYITYDFVIGVPVTIMAHDDTRCLIIRPIYLGDWGEVEGWYIVLGSCARMQCKNLSENLREQAKQVMRKDLSEHLASGEERERLQTMFDLPQILSIEFEMNDDTTITIDGDDGIIIQQYGESPWWVDTKSSRRLPTLLKELDNMDEFFQMRTHGILEPDLRLKARGKPDYTTSIEIMKIIIIYNALFIIPFLMMDLNAVLELAVVLVVVNPFLLFIAYIDMKDSMKNDCICPCFLFLVGFLSIIGSIGQMVIDYEPTGLFALLLGIYGVIGGILFTVIRWERSQPLNSSKEN